MVALNDLSRLDPLVAALVEAGRAAIEAELAERAAADEAHMAELRAEWAAVTEAIRGMLPEAVQGYVVALETDHAADFPGKFCAARLAVPGLAPIEVNAALRGDVWVLNLHGRYPFRVPRAMSSYGIGPSWDWQFGAEGCEVLERALALALAAQRNFDELRAAYLQEREEEGKRGPAARRVEYVDDLACGLSPQDALLDNLRAVVREVVRAEIG